MQYHDNRFGQHPQFRYYLYNLIMHHRIRATTSIFVKRNLEDTLPTTVSTLLTNLDQVLDSHVVDHVMRFEDSLRGTRSFWNKKRGELYDMITQLGSQTLLFTLSVVETKWIDLHMLMPCPHPSSLPTQFQWRIQNIITNPHIASLYMHHQFTIFLEEILQNISHTKDCWCKFASSPILDFSFRSHLLN